VRFIVLTFLLAGCGTDVDLGGAAPTGSDGGTTCGTLVAPEIDAGCKACSKTSTDCQPNGCYGGYWCDTAINDCNSPPKSCP